MTLTSRINWLLRRVIGIEIHKTRAGFDEARMNVIKTLGIDCVLDGGANSGQYATRIRGNGFQGKIISFEPGSSAFEKLETNAKIDAQWDCVKVALGSQTQSLHLNLATNDGMSSSLKQPGDHLTEFPSVLFEGTELVQVVTLESVLANIDSKTLIKLDVQGFELEALKGLGKEVDKVLAIELEMTLIPMYVGEATLGNVVNYVEDLGFQIFSISEFGKKANGQVTYFDLIAVKEVV